MRPSRGWSQRSSASKPAMVRSSSRTIGWNSTLISPRSSARRRSLSSVELVAAVRSAWSAGTPRCGRRRGAWHAPWRSRRSCSISSRRAAICGSCRAMPIEAVRKISRSAKVIGVVIARRTMSAKRDDPVGLALRQQDDRELVAGDARQRVLRLQQPARGDATGSAGSSRRPHRPTASLTCLKRSRSMHEHGRPDAPRPALAKVSAASSRS